jgi:hypothetical protein
VREEDIGVTRSRYGQCVRAMRAVLRNRPPRSLVFRRSGLGDDLTVFWAVLGGVLQQLIPENPRLFFERHETRAFLATVARAFPGIEVVDEAPPRHGVAYVRHTSHQFRQASLWHMLCVRIRHGPSSFYEPYWHKWLSEHGNPWVAGWRLRVAMALGLIRAWRTPYDGTYDGWQQLSLAYGFSASESEVSSGRLATAWPLIRERLDVSKGPIVWSGAPPLFFPAGGSFQDFDEAFVRRVTDVTPGVKLVRFADDTAPADLRYGDLLELRTMISRAALVITNDSLPSHLAQFYARRHILICTRSRPSNVCFPGAMNTVVVDLGGNLPCRPCAYYPLTRPTCPAGFARCAGQQDASLEKQLVHALRVAMRPEVRHSASSGGWAN